MLEFIAVVGGFYLFSVLLVFWILTNNVFIFRSKNYTIPFGLQEGMQKKGWLEPEGVRYWVCKNQSRSQKWVIMFHSWGRNSARMIPRAEIYWKRGYSLLFVDAWSHGQSKYHYSTSAPWYAEHAKKICDLEGIKSPIVHGLSFGSAAATIFAKEYGANAVVAEARFNNVKEMMFDFLRYMKIPIFLYGWVVNFVMKIDFPWDLPNAKNNLPHIQAPIFLIHGENDRMFKVEKHFIPNKQMLKKSDSFWVVPNSKHSKMFQHPDYEQLLNNFISQVETQLLAEKMRSSENIT